MTELLPGLVGVCIFLVLVVFGVRIAFSAMIAGLVTFWLVYGDLTTVGTVIAGRFFTESATYALTVIPLFVFMGFLAQHYGAGAAIYTTARAWLGRLPGGLAIATVMGCAFFGAICGVSPVAVALFGRVAVPEMEQAGYDWRLSVGSIASAGTLADMIPPSSLLVLYAMLARQSVGKLLIAGIIPGIISAITYSVMIILRCIKNPNLGPPGPSTTFREKIISMKGITVVIVVMVIIIGGIYSGFFTPTEAAAWSALVMLVAGFVTQRGLKWPLFKASLLDTAVTSCMIFMLIVGIQLMSTALISSGAIGSMVNFFEGLEVSNYLLLGAAIVIYLILGAFVGVLGMLVMTVPFLIPILEAAGFDPIWLGIIVIKFCEIALITPPIGANVFVVATVTGRDASQCFKAISWFLIIDLVNVGLLVAFPQIVTFLPSLM